MEGAGEEGEEEGARRPPGPGNKVVVVGAQTVQEAEEGEQASSRVEAGEVWCCPLPTREGGEGGHQGLAMASVWVVVAVVGCCQ